MPPQEQRPQFPIRYHFPIHPPVAAALPLGSFQLSPTPSFRYPISSFTLFTPTHFHSSSRPLSPFLYRSLTARPCPTCVASLQPTSSCTRILLSCTIKTWKPKEPRHKEIYRGDCPHVARKPKSTKVGRRKARESFHTTKQAICEEKKVQNAKLGGRSIDDQGG